jgi:hypothetical protein
MKRNEIRLIVEYANRVQLLCNGLRLPQSPAGTPDSTRKDAERQIGADWSKQAKRLLQDEWPAIRRIFEDCFPQAVQSLNESRQAILDEARQEPYGGINHLEPRTDRSTPEDELRSGEVLRLVPDEKLRSLIDQFVRELRDYAGLANASFPRQLWGFFASRSLLEKIIAGIIVTIVGALFGVPLFKTFVPWLRDAHVAHPMQDPNRVAPEAN